MKGVHFQEESLKFKTQRKLETCIECREDALCIKLCVCEHTYCSICAKQKIIRPVGSPVNSYLVDCTACKQQRKLQDRLQFYYSTNPQQKKEILNSEKCPVCQKQFGVDLEKNWPHSVPCLTYGHMICTSCFMKKLQEWVQVRVKDFKSRKQGRGERPSFKCPICNEDCKSIRYVSRKPKELMDKFVRLNRKHIIQFKGDRPSFKKNQTKSFKEDKQKACFSPVPQQSKSSLESNSNQQKQPPDLKSALELKKGQNIKNDSEKDDESDEEDEDQQIQFKGNASKYFLPKKTSSKRLKVFGQKMKVQKFQDSLKPKKVIDKIEEQDKGINCYESQDDQEQELFEFPQVDDKSITFPKDRSFVVLTCLKNQHHQQHKLPKNQIFDIPLNQQIDFSKFVKNYQIKCKACNSRNLRVTKVFIQNAVIFLQYSGSNQGSIKEFTAQFRHTKEKKNYRLYEMVDYNVFIAKFTSLD